MVQGVREKLSEINGGLSWDPRVTPTPAYQPCDLSMLPKSLCSLSLGVFLFNMGASTAPALQITHLKRSASQAAFSHRKLSLTLLLQRRAQTIRNLISEAGQEPQVLDSDAGVCFPHGISSSLVRASVAQSTAAFASCRVFEADTSTMRGQGGKAN